MFPTTQFSPMSYRQLLKLKSRLGFVEANSGNHATLLLRQSSPFLIPCIGTICLYDIIYALTYIKLEGNLIKIQRLPASGSSEEQENGDRLPITRLLHNSKEIMIQKAKRKLRRLDIHVPPTPVKKLRLSRRRIIIDSDSDSESSELGSIKHQVRNRKDEKRTSHRSGLESPRDLKSLNVNNISKDVKKSERKFIIDSDSDSNSDSESYLEPLINSSSASSLTKGRKKLRRLRKIPSKFIDIKPAQAPSIVGGKSQRGVRPTRQSQEKTAASIVLQMMRKKRTRKDVVQRQQKVREALVAKCRIPKSGNFRSLKASIIQKAFEIIDYHFIDGYLKRLIVEEGRKVSFRVAPKMTQTAGHVMTDSRKPRYHSLAISSFLLSRSFGTESSRKITVNGLKCEDRLEAMLRIIEHEMVHIILFCDGIPSDGDGRNHHGPLFQMAARNIFGHTHFRHDLVTPWEEAGNAGIVGGAMVSFQIDGKTLEGRVNRVTKRVTVLVKTSSRNKRAREFSDGNCYVKYYVPVAACTPI